MYKVESIARKRRFFFFSSRRRHTRYWRDWSSDVCSSDLDVLRPGKALVGARTKPRNLDAVRREKAARRCGGIRHLLSGWQCEGRHRRCIAIVAFVGREEVGPVLTDRAAHGGAILDALRRVVGQRAVGIRAARAQALVLEQRESRPPELVRSRTRDDGDDTARGLSVLRLEAVDEDLYFLDRVERRALVREAGDLIAVVDAVHVEGVRTAARPAETVGSVIGGGSRHQPDRIRVVAARQRQQVDLLAPQR